MFRQPTVEYLGLVLSEDWVEMDPVKVAGICDWPTLTSVTKVQSFVRFVNFYCQSIQDLLHVAMPLHQLTKKGEAWRWTKAKLEAFKEYKQLIMSTMHFQLEMDASRYAT